MTAAAVAELVWGPQPGPQTALLSCPIRDVLYGGARGGGKTDGLLGDFLAHARRHGRHAKGILFRRSYDEFEEIEARSAEVYGPAGWRYAVSKRTWWSPDGAMLKLRYLEDDRDATRYQGHSYTWEGVDEAGNFPSPEPIDKLWGALRSPAGVPCVRRMTANPGGVGHHWIKRRYMVDDAGRRIPPMTPLRYRPQPELRPDLWMEAVFIAARLEDNPALFRGPKGQDYEAGLAAAAGPALYKAWRYGDWDVIAGAAFEEWSQDVHVVDQFRVPKHWAYAAGMDWGYRNPGWFGLAALSPDGDVLVFDEIYFRQQTAYQVGYDVGMLVRRYAVTVDYIACDEQMWYNTGLSAPTLAEEFRNGLWAAFGRDASLAPPVIEATHGRGSRVTKAAVMHHYLRYKQEADGSIKPWNRPMLRFTANCAHAIRTIPTLPPSASNPEDVDTDAEDHPYDGVTALLMSRPPRPEPLPKPTPRDRHPGFVKRRRKHPEHVDSLGGRPTFGTMPWHVARPGELEPLDGGIGT